MSIAGYGVGRNLTIAGGYAAYGFGILDLFPGVIIAKFGIIIYDEVRRQLVAEENRICIIREDA